MGLFVWDDFDCAYDVILGNLRRSKRRRRDIGEFEINSCSHTLKRTLEDKRLGDGMVDEEYKAFLNGLAEYSGWRNSVGEDNNDDEEGDEEDDMDPQYKMFLENLKEDGKSYVLEVTINNKTPLSMKYEAEGGSDDDHEPPTMKRKIQDTERMEAAKDLRNLPSKDKLKTQKNMRNVGSKDTTDSNKNTGNAIGKGGGNLLVEKDLKSEPANHGHSCRKLSPKGNHLFKVEPECQTAADMVDKCYQTFIKNFKEVGDCMIYDNEDGKWVVVYEGDDESKVLAAVKALDFNKGQYPFETSRLFDSLMEEDKQHQCLGNPDAGKNSEFREKLMGKLREPYDHKEYEKLWQIINEWRPMSGRHRDLRGPAALKSYSKEECSPSYLELHICLKRKIEAVKFDRCKVLNLLRGFFFWLENLVYEDAFLPWLDPLCLAVMPKNH